LQFPLGANPSLARNTGRNLKHAHS
jgi:hypothetical protein